MFAYAAPRAVSLSQFSQPVAKESPSTITPDGDPQSADGATQLPIADATVDDHLPVNRALPKDEPLDPTSAMDNPATQAVVGGGLRPGERVLVDSLIGQVNGRPIFAHDVLDPIEGTLRAIARDMEDNAGQARAAFAVVVARGFRRIVENELVLADAESELTAQQRQGFLMWLTELKQDFKRKFGEGSQSLTEERLREEGEADSLDEKIGSIRDVELIRGQFRKKVSQRVIVSWRDVQREYERRKGEFNPPASMTLGILALGNKDDVENIAYVKERLAAGDTFESLADRFGGEPRPFELDTEGKPKGLVATLRDVAAQLASGETSEAVEVRTSTVWVHLYEIQRPAPRTIYDRDVQFAVRDDLRNRRHFAEADRYLAGLENRDKNTDLDQMERRLLDIAIRRYLR